MSLSADESRRKGIPARSSSGTTAEPVIVSDVSPKETGIEGAVCLTGFLVTCGSCGEPMRSDDPDAIAVPGRRACGRCAQSHR